MQGESVCSWLLLVWRRRRFTCCFDQPQSRGSLPRTENPGSNTQITLLFVSSVSLSKIPASFEEYDDLAWDHGDGLFDAWKKQLYSEDIHYEIAATIVKHRVGGKAMEICAPQGGAFNVYYRIRFSEDSDEPAVTSRPLSINVAQLANFARVPHFELPSVSNTYETSSYYCAALADMHLQQLSYQRNWAVESEEECRGKYAAR